MLPNPIYPFASIDHRHRCGRIFGIREHDLLRHVYVLGKTGTGKTALLERLLISVIRAGGGCGLIDPHGDLAERLLDFIPRTRTNDVVLLDPADMERPVGMNLFDQVLPECRHLVASGVLSVFRKLYAESWGPRTEHVLRNVVRGLLDVRGATLLGVPRMLLEDRYRESVASQVQDPLVRFFWTREFPTYPKPFLAEVIAPVLNKSMALLASPVTRNIVGQHSSTIVPREIMDCGRILIANLAKGRIGEEASALLGAVLVTKFQLAAYSRADLPEEERMPFVLVLDEFTAFVTRSFAEILAEARKYGMGLVLAHQHVAQLDDAMRAAVLGNAGSLLVFRIGAEDAEVIGREFMPELAPLDLARLGQHQLAVRLSMDGVTSPPFTAVTLPPLPPPERTNAAETIRRTSRDRYGRPRERVEKDVEGQIGVR